MSQDSDTLHKQIYLQSGLVFPQNPSCRHKLHTVKANSVLMQGHAPLRTHKVGACLKPGITAWADAALLEVQDNWTNHPTPAWQAVLWKKRIRAVLRHPIDTSPPIFALSLHGKINTGMHGCWNCMQKVLNKSGEEIEEASGDLRDKTKVSSSET